MKSSSVPQAQRRRLLAARRGGLVALLGATLGLSFGVPTVRATTATQAITFGVSYAQAGHPWDLGYPPVYPMYGDWLTIVGPVSAFRAPFADLDTATPGVEYTYRMSGLTMVQWSLWDDFEHNEGGYGLQYEGGLLEIFRDTTPDANFNDPATFADGELLLTGTIPSFALVFWSSYVPPQSAAVQFTGGSLFARVSEHGVGTTAFNSGNFVFNRSSLPAGILQAGYFARSQTKLDVELPVPVQPTTWSGIKALFR